MQRGDGPHVPIGHALATALVAVVLVGCASGQQGRPDAAAWQARWEETLALVPPADEVGPGSDQVCEDVLVDLREARPGLSPAPDQVVEEAMATWMATAESTFFECFDVDTGADPVDEAYRRLDRLEAEVTAALPGSDPT